jgi:hypothetical protein
MSTVPIRMSNVEMASSGLKRRNIIRLGVTQLGFSASI